ncbi:hypothetical protein Tco_1188556 [Tanacetum coccineum]
MSASGISALRLVDGAGSGIGVEYMEIKKNGGSRGVGASSSAGTKSSGCSGSGIYTGTWSSGTYSGDVVPAPTTVGQPPRKDPQMEYSKIEPHE